MRTLANVAAGDRILLDLTMSAAAHTTRGAPSELQALLECPAQVAAGPPTAGEDEIRYTLRWYNKTATHAPETIWFSNVPVLTPATRTTVHLAKLGSAVDAEDADLGCDGHRRTCGVHLHGVGDGGATLRNGLGALQMTSFDGAMVSVGGTDPVPTPLVRPDPAKGLHFPLVGNIWNTNCEC